MFKKLLDNPALPSLLLRTGLAVIFLYAAASSLVNPREWIGYMPGFLVDNLPEWLLMESFAVYELLLAAWLLSGVYTRYAALLAAATLAGIIVTNFHLFAVTFRDIALVFTALALAVMSKKQRD